MFPFILQPGFCSVQPSGQVNSVSLGKTASVGMGLSVSVAAIVLVNLAVAMSVGAFVGVAVCTGDWLSPGVSVVDRFSLNLGSKRSMPPLSAFLSIGLRSSF